MGEPWDPWDSVDGSPLGGVHPPCIVSFSLNSCGLWPSSVLSQEKTVSETLMYLSWLLKVRLWRAWSGRGVGLWGCLDLNILSSGNLFRMSPPMMTDLNLFLIIFFYRVKLMACVELSEESCVHALALWLQNLDFSFRRGVWMCLCSYSVMWESGEADPPLPTMASISSPHHCVMGS